ncbi:retrovirus-related pol polyprotein from transposon TNT 1-94 [Tanacetum coccineum]
MIHGIMKEGIWILDHSQIKEEFLNFFKEKFKNYDSNVDFSPFSNSSGLCALDRDSLKTPVSVDEVMNTVWDCGSSKALDPDWFSFSFVKRYWDYIKVDILEYVNIFLDTGSLSYGSNSSFFTLIPKIRACLSSSRALILVNGSPTLKLYNKRGLRQGDPLSPFLFILVMQGLHNALSIAVSSGLIRGVKFGSPEVTISHIFYADDVIITTEWNSNDLDNIIRVLQVFYLASSLKINIQKSNIYGIEVSDVDVSSMASNSGCASGSFPFTYLGLPIGSNVSLTSSWQVLLDKFQSKLSLWKENLLSVGGRHTLIKAVLGSIGIYYFSIFKVYESVLNSLERSRVMFFWGGSHKARKVSWIKWTLDALLIRRFSLLWVHRQFGTNIPRKVNIFIWRLILDRLPHKLNLSSRGIDIQAISYPSCNGNVESSNHIFCWFTSWRMVKEKSRRLLVISSSSLWWLWRYIDTRPNGDVLRKCILEGPYTPTTVVILAVPAMDNSPTVPERTTVETILNISPENKAHFESEKEAIHLILTGIGDEIYSTVDACKTAHEMWEAIESQYSISSTTSTRMVKQYQKEVNEIRAERISKHANPLALVAAAQPYQDPYYQAPKSHKSYAPTSKASLPTRSHATTRNKGKEIAKLITPPSESASEEDSDPEQAQKDKEMQKNLALIAKYFKKLYKPTNNNLRTSSNTKNKNVDTTLRYKNDNQTGQFGNQRTMTVAGARETVGSQVVQRLQSGIQCFNCKEFEQSDWLADTDEEIDEQELEAHYNYMEKIQEVPNAYSGTDSELLEHVQYDTGYNVFSNEIQHSEQSESISNTCVVETSDSNVIHDSPNMCDNDIQNDQNDVECDDERVALANLIANLKLDVDENKKIQKQLKKANTTLAHELTECKYILAEISRTLEESNSIRDSCLVALKNKQTELEKYKTFNDRTVDYEKLEHKLNETLGLLAQKDIDIK